MEYSWIWGPLLFVGCCVMGVLAIPFAMIWSNHRRKMAELSLRRDGLITQQVAAELEAIREEIHALRETTLQYDLSFDTALQQTERRLTHLERQARSQAQEPQQNVSLGGR